MEDYWFKSFEKIQNFQMPFSFEGEGLDDWLHSIPVMDAHAACSNLLGVLQELEAAELEPAMKLSYLKKIHASAEGFSANLEGKFLDSSFPLVSTEKNSVELVTCLYAKMADCYFQVFERENDPSSRQMRAYALYQALRCMGKAQVYVAEVYQWTFPGFWQNCYRYFQEAGKAGLVKEEIVDENGNPRTIENIFKQILLFEMCDANQYRPREMKKIFDFLEQFAGTALILSGNLPMRITEGCFCLDQDLPPGNLAKLGGCDESTVLQITTTNVAEKIYNYLKEHSVGHGALGTINRALYMRAVKTLSMSQKRKFTRVKESKECSGIIGFENLINFIRAGKKVDAETGQPHDPRLAGHWTTPDLDLVEEGEERAHQIRSSLKDRMKKDEKLKKILAMAKDSNREIWGRISSPDIGDLHDIPIGSFEILDSSVRGYGVMWKEKNLKVKIGEVFGVLVDEGKRIEIGLIRKIRASGDSEIRLGIELIGLESRAVCMTSPGDGKHSSWALLLPAVKGVNVSDSILYSSSDFHTGEFVSLKEDDSTKHCRLSKILHSTPAVNHVELFYPTV